MEYATSKVLPAVTHTLVILKTQVPSFQNCCFTYMEIQAYLID